MAVGECGASSGAKIATRIMTARMTSPIRALLLLHRVTKARRTKRTGPGARLAVVDGTLADPGAWGGGTGATMVM